MKSVTHMLSFSGGKDSTALYLRAMELSNRLGALGQGMVVVFADTGNEHEITLDYVRQLPERTGGPAVTWVKADFTADFERKRRYMQEKWPLKGVPQDRIDRALELFHPTGIPFLDMCMLKGRFPSQGARFCTELTKIEPIFEQVVMPLLDAGRKVLNWQGVRAEESPARAAQRRFEHRGGGYWIWRPLHRWTAADVFALHRRHGVEPNPLYKQGMGRVGCMPCINCSKNELWEIARRFPEHIDRIAAWEDLVGDVSRRGVSSFFAVDKTPEGAANRDKPIPHIRQVVQWASTDRGGRQVSLLKLGPAPVCASEYGLCE